VHFGKAFRIVASILKTRTVSGNLVEYYGMRTVENNEFVNLLVIWYSGTIRTGSNLLTLPGECAEIII